MFALAARPSRFIRHAYLCLAAAIIALALPLAARAAAPAPTIVSVDNIYTSETLANCKLFIPEGVGPWPAVVVTHGVGGLWQGDNVAGGIMSTHFEELGVLFQNKNYIALFVDCYTPRGLVEFENRQFAMNPAIDDTICSDRYVRPTDLYSALAYLQNRSDVIADRVGLLGFSHGGQSTLVSVLSSSITDHKTSWTMQKLNSDDTTTSSVIVAAPKTNWAAAPNTQRKFKCAVAYYPGGGFRSFFGPVAGTANKLYMPYCPTLMHHGDQDSLYTSGYPTALVAKSQSHATFISGPTITYAFTLPNNSHETGTNPLYHIVYPGVGHSFDELQSGDTGFSEKTAARTNTFKWLDYYLEPTPPAAVADWTLHTPAQ